MISINVDPLTVDNFAPYGRILTIEDLKPSKSGEGWVCYSPIDFMQQVKPMTGIGMVQSSVVPNRITSMERHVSREELLWSTTKSLVLIVDKPSNLGYKYAQPDAQTAKAFLIKAGQAVIMNRGTWHTPAFALDGVVTYFFAIDTSKDFIDQEKNPWINFHNDLTLSVKNS